ncbi:MAG: fused MFS/spermidine synthase [Patescibacteria group bacterium]
MWHMRSVTATHEHIKNEPITWMRRGVWLSLAALPVALMIATTQRMTQVIAPIPFLWVVPLALYLLSFVLAFEGWGRGGTVPALIALFAASSFLFLDVGVYDIGKQLFSNLALFFAGSLFCHSLLYEYRPLGHQSAIYYVWVALGGAIGTFAMSILAPVYVRDFLEFVFILLAVGVLAIALFPATTYIRDEFHKNARTLKMVCAFLAIYMVGQFVYMQTEGAVYASRDFYGMIKVYEYNELRSLYHGTTLHGTQRMTGEMILNPTTYYVPTSGAGRAILAMREVRGKQPLDVGVVGLGAGTLAGYCRKSDHFSFYEIDPRVEKLARERFTYLNACEKSEVHIGDGRLLLVAELKEGSKQYDVLLIDAFSDDTVPVHLLTKEAIELYFKHLRDDNGIVGVHTSSRYLELSPVIMRIAQELGLSARVVSDDVISDESEGASSVWVVLSKNQKAFVTPQFVTIPEFVMPTTTPLWTDDYANVFGTVTFSMFKLWTN